MGNQYEQDEVRGDEKLPEDEEIIELTDIVDQVPGERKEESIELSAESNEVIAEELDHRNAENDFVSSLGVEIEPEEESLEEFGTISSQEQEPISVTAEQLEAALERVIVKMFSEKIEGILVEVIEKAVAKEIDRLKTALLEDTTGSE